MTPRLLSLRYLVLVLALTSGTTGCGTTKHRVTPPAPQPSFPRAVALVKSGIVRIETTTCDGGEIGTGFLLSKRLVATVEHVIDGGQSITLKQNGRVVAHGTVVGEDRTRDLALVRTDRAVKGAHLNLSERTPRLAETVEAIGFPLGLPLSASRGSVSGLGRTVPIGGISRKDMVQTDAAVNPGNSGGPLVTITGAVVGLVDLKETDASGLAFAVSSRVARPLFSAWAAAPQPVQASGCAAPPPPSSNTASFQTFSGSDFSIAYPSAFVVTAAEVNKGSYYDTTIEDGTYLIRIDENPTGASGNLEQDAAPVINGVRREPGYQEVSLAETVFLGYDALRWEFEVPENGILLHKVDIFFVGDTGAEWGLLDQAPASDWPQVSAAFEDLNNTFVETR